MQSIKDPELAANQGEQKGFVFPAAIEITVVGNADGDLPNLVLALLLESGLQANRSSLTVRESRAGKYQSISLTVAFESREQYASAHATLRAHPNIKWTL